MWWRTSGSVSSFSLNKTKLKSIFSSEVPFNKYLTYHLRDVFLFTHGHHLYHNSYPWWAQLPLQLGLHPMSILCIKDNECPSIYHHLTCSVRALCCRGLLEPIKQQGVCVCPVLHREHLPISLTLTPKQRRSPISLLLDCGGNRSIWRNTDRPLLGYELVTCCSAVTAQYTTPLWHPLKSLNALFLKITISIELLSTNISIPYQYNVNIYNLKCPLDYVYKQKGSLEERITTVLSFSRVSLLWENSS